jgi:hypothetical protein
MLEVRPNLIGSYPVFAPTLVSPGYVLSGCLHRSCWISRVLELHHIKGGPRTTPLLLSPKLSTLCGSSLNRQIQSIWVTEPDIAALVFLLVMCQAEYTHTMGNPEGQCECKGRAVVPLLLPRSNCRCQENRRRGRSWHWSIWTMMVLGLLILSIGTASASDLGERASIKSDCSVAYKAILLRAPRYFTSMAVV